MHIKICLRCHRYAPNCTREDAWWCAERLSTLPSAVVPRHSCYTRDKFIPITNETETPPLWCEFLMEQSITTPDDNVPEPTPISDLIYTGHGVEEDDDEDEDDDAALPWTQSRHGFPTESMFKWRYQETVFLDNGFKEEVDKKVKAGLSIVRKLKGKK